MNNLIIKFAHIEEGDYTVDTLNVTALANGQTDNVELTLRVDAVAQEPNEKFSITLNPLVAPTPREGLFFLDTIQVTIVDSDSKDDCTCIMTSRYEVLGLRMTSSCIVIRVQVVKGCQYYSDSFIFT